MIKETNVQVLELSPKEADQLLGINEFPSQRKLTAEIVRQYTENMHKKSHRRVEIAIAKVKETGKTFLMNGQHNCTAIKEYGKPYPALLTQYDCDTMMDANDLFNTFDISNRRTERQFIAGAKEVYDQRLRKCSNLLLQYCGSALLNLNGNDPAPAGCDRHDLTKTLKMKYCDQYVEEVLFVEQFFSHKHLKEVGVITAMICSYRVDPDAAQEFWDKVATGEMLSYNDPILNLREALLHGNSIRSGAVRKHDVYKVCAAYWNTWRNGEIRMMVKVTSMKSIPTML